MVEATDTGPNKLWEDMVLDRGDSMAKSGQERLEIDIRVCGHVRTALECVVLTLLSVLQELVSHLWGDTELAFIDIPDHRTPHQGSVSTPSEPAPSSFPVPSSQALRHSVQPPSVTTCGSFDGCGQVHVRELVRDHMRHHEMVEAEQMREFVSMSLVVCSVGTSESRQRAHCHPMSSNPEIKRFEIAKPVFRG
jgi:hypothetical protein